MKQLEVLQSQLLPLKKLKPNTGQIPGLPANPRRITDIQLSRLKRSIQQNPEMLSLREILVYHYEGEYVVIGGNQRIAALSDMPVKDIPCKIIPQNATPEQLRAYLIKDNIEFGEWVDVMLARDWSLDELDDFGMDDVDRLEAVVIPEADEREEEKIETVQIIVGRKRFEVSTEEVLLFKERALDYFSEHGTYIGFISHILGKDED